ncbi:hypothetical protein R3P38DRAFT_3277341 [Favolaschia claudopus]|uniref:Uncharacterized protein n=1 Tax=Favolaschia claudopus TaxID=2862362 RepID=A0AAW0AN22_9AGAR
MACASIVGILYFILGTISTPPIPRSSSELRLNPSILASLATLALSPSIQNSFPSCDSQSCLVAACMSIVILDTISTLSDLLRPLAAPLTSASTWRSTAHHFPNPLIICDPQYQPLIAIALTALAYHTPLQNMFCYRSTTQLPLVCLLSRYHCHIYGTYSINSLNLSSFTYLVFL